MKRLAFLILILAMPQAFADCIFREDTASQTFLVGPFLDQTDGATAETALTVANTDIRVSKNGGNTAAKNSGGCTHDEAGMYQCTFDATDTDTAGTLQIYTDDVVNATDIVPVFHECLVYSTGFFDLIDGTDSLLTSRQTGNDLLTTVSSVTSQTEIVLSTGATNNDAYNEQTIKFVGGTEECEQRITDYVGSTKTVTLESACPFTVAGTDDAYIFTGSSGSAMRVAQNDLDTITGTSGVNLESDSIDATVIAADSIGASELAADAIGSSELATTAVTEIQTGLATSSALGTVDTNVDAILADTGTDGVVLATDAVDADALAANAVDEIWDEVIETAGSTYTARCIQAISLSYAAGTWSTSGAVSTFRDPGDNTNRIVGTITSTTRGSITITCP